MNNSYDVNYLPSATQDLEHILDYIIMDNPSAAIKFVDNIDTKIDNLSLFPYSGSIPNDNRLKKLGYRILIINNYLVFYVIKVPNKEVEIRRILSSKQRYEFLLR